MDLFSLLFMLCGLTYIGAIIYFANQLEANRVARLPLQGIYAISGQDTQAIILRWMLYGVVMIIVMIGLFLVQIALLSQLEATLSPQAQELAISTGAALVGIIMTVFSAGTGYVFIRFDTARQWLYARLHPKTAYDPQSSVHLAALVLMLALVDWMVITFLLQGGVQGIADGIAETGIRPTDLLFNLVLQLAVTFMGVGLAFRRGISQTLDRLGLRLPTLQDMIWGILTAIGFIVLMIVFNIVWSLFVPVEQISAETVALEQLNRSLATLPLAFLVAFTASIGEELWIRGALQPIFGIGITTIFFTMLHTQTGLTPAVLLIALLSIGLGLLRQKVSTTAAIIAHFFFNFIPLALLSLAGDFI